MSSKAELRAALITIQAQPVVELAAFAKAAVAARGHEAGPGIGKRASTYIDTIAKPDRAGAPTRSSTDIVSFAERTGRSGEPLFAAAKAATAPTLAGVDRKADNHSPDGV